MDLKTAEQAFVCELVKKNGTDDSFRQVMKGFKTELRGCIKYTSRIVSNVFPLSSKGDFFSE